MEQWTKTCGKIGLKCQIGLKMELLSNDQGQQVVPIKPQFLYMCICIWSCYHVANFKVANLFSWQNMDCQKFCQKMKTLNLCDIFKPPKYPPNQTIKQPWSILMQQVGQCNWKAKNTQQLVMRINQKTKLFTRAECKRLFKSLNSRCP